MLGGNLRSLLYREVFVMYPVNTGTGMRENIFNKGLCIKHNSQIHNAYVYLRNKLNFW